EARIEVEALLVGRAAVGHDARPAHAEAVGVEAELGEQGDVVRHPVVVVDRRLRGVAVRDVAGGAREVVPDRIATAVLVRGALDLLRRGRGAPQEALRPAEAGREVERHQPFTAPDMMPLTSWRPAA